MKMLLGFLLVLVTSACGSKDEKSQRPPSEAEINRQIELMKDAANLNFQQEFASSENLNETFLKWYFEGFSLVPTLSSLANTNADLKIALEGMLLDIKDGIKRGAEAKKNNSSELVQAAFVHFGYINGCFKIGFYIGPDVKQLNFIESIYQKYVSEIPGVRSEKDEDTLTLKYSNEAKQDP